MIGWFLIKGRLSGGSAPNRRGYDPRIRSADVVEKGCRFKVFHEPFGLAHVAGNPTENSVTLREWPRVYLSRASTAAASAATVSI